MKEPTLPTRPVLLVDADRDTENALGAVLSSGGFSLLVATTSGEAFKILKDRMGLFELVVVDVDPGAHGLALLEAVNACANRPPLIVISALEESYMTPIAQSHGAVACFGKPVNAKKLGAALKRGWSHARTSDRWGSLVPESPKSSLTRETFRGIASKLSPH